jgi:hypothetical protein
MTAALAAVALAIGYALWWIAPTAQRWLGLEWAADFGQLCLVILALSVIGKVAERFLPHPGQADTKTVPPANQVI